MASTSYVPGESIDPAFAAFNVLESAPYKQLPNGQEIPCSILVPKSPKSNNKPTKLPIFIHWHAGALVMGHRLFSGWWPAFTRSLAEEKSAIIISPDYRLLPESNGLDILEDVKDFLAWLFASSNSTSSSSSSSGTSRLKKLPNLLPEGIEPDFDNVLSTGESAGGWHAIQTAFVNAIHSFGMIRGVIASYPMIDMRGPHFSAPDNSKHILGLPVLDPDILQRHLAKIKEDQASAPKGIEAVTSLLPPAGMDTFSISLREGLFTSLFGDDTSLFPIDLLENPTISEMITKGSFPPIWILHGSEDTAVPVDGTLKFQRAFEERFPDFAGNRLKLSIREGEEHGFENHIAAGGIISLQDDWVREGLDFLGL